MTIRYTLEKEYGYKGPLEKVLGLEIEHRDLFSPSISQLTNLESFIYKGSSFTQSLMAHTSLRKLVIMIIRAPLGKDPLSKDLDMMSSLTHLELINSISPPSLHQLTALKVLSLVGMDLCDPPNYLDELPLLETLSLKKNLLDFFTFPTKCSLLSSVNLSGNQLIDIDTPNIVTSITHLKLKNNPNLEITDELINKLPNLSTLITSSPFPLIPSITDLKVFNCLDCLNVNLRALCHLKIIASSPPNLNTDLIPIFSLTQLQTLDICGEFHFPDILGNDAENFIYLSQLFIGNIHGVKTESLYKLPSLVIIFAYHLSDPLNLDLMPLLQEVGVNKISITKIHNLIFLKLSDTLSVNKEGEEVEEYNRILSLLPKLQQVFFNTVNCKLSAEKSRFLVNNQAREKTLQSILIKEKKLVLLDE